MQTLADGALALASLRAAARECAATAKRFSPEQSTEAVAYANTICALFSKSTTDATTAEMRVEHQAPLLPQLPTELTVEVLQHLNVRSLGRLARTCRELYFGPPCPPRPASLVEAAIRPRADEIGRWTPSSLPTGVSNWVPFLLEREWRRGMELRTVAAGWARSCFVDANGALLVCGSVPGQFGLPEGLSPASHMAALVPTPVPSMAGVRIRAVVCSYRCNLAVSEAGQVFAWGLSGPWVGTGFAEENLLVPTPVLALQTHRVCQIFAGMDHFASRSEDDSHDGSNGDYDDYHLPKLNTALLGERVRSIAAGLYMSCAVTDAGALYTLGQNKYGNLGHGDDTTRYTPTLVQGLDGIRVVGVAAHMKHTLALAADGSVYAFGEGPGLGTVWVGAAEQADGATSHSPHRVPDLVCMVQRQYEW
jgi:hypothetical protein